MICTKCEVETPLAIYIETGVKAAVCSICGAKSNGIVLPTEDGEVEGDTDDKRASKSIKPVFVVSVQDLLWEEETRIVPGKRGPQLKVAQEIQHSLHQGKPIIAEAGTGTGKTLAYLSAAAAWGDRVIVATATKALQDQILQEDGPLIVDALKKYGVHRSIVKFKGKGNYACLAQARDAKVKERMAKLDIDAIAKFESWLDGMEKGQHDGDLDFYDDLPRFHNLIRVDECRKNHCRYRDRCGYLRMRKKADQAHVVVTNHHTLAHEHVISKRVAGGANSMKQFLVGPRSAVVLDEAHKLQDAFESALETSITTRTLKNLCDRIRSVGVEYRSGESGVREVVLQDYVNDEGVESGDISYTVKVKYFNDLSKELLDYPAYDPDVLTRLQGRLTNERFVESSLKFGSVTLGANNEQHLKKLAAKVYADLVLVSFGVAGWILYAKKSFDDALSEAGGLYSDIPSGVVDEYYTSRSIDQRLKSLKAVLHDWVFPTDEYVFYIDKDPYTEHGFTLNSNVLDISHSLKSFWKDNPVHVLSSATMSSTVRYQKSFDMFQRRLGLEIPDHQIIEVESPFNYKSHCVTYLENDGAFRKPGSNRSGELYLYYEKMADRIVDTVDLTRGNTLVLFSSNEDLDEVQERTEWRLKQKGYDLFVQKKGVASATAAVEAYEARAREQLDAAESLRRGPVLYGVNSLWEGISLKGLLLVSVIITRVKFPYQGDPILKKRSELMGDGAFTALSLYPAIIFMKQGTGRLLRTKKDAGIVSILDPRVSNSRWGQDMLSSLEVSKTIVRDQKSLKEAWNKYLEPYHKKRLRVYKTKGKL